MLNELNEESTRSGLKINAEKTKLLMTEKNIEPLKIGDQQIESVKSFIYLGRKISISNAMDGEIRRRLQAGWAVFAKYCDFLKAKRVQMSLKRQLFDMCILPAILYGCETWKMSKADETRIQVEQRKWNGKWSICRFSIEELMNGSEA